MVLYSHSRLTTFEQCPLKFKFRYIDKLKPEIKQTIEGFLGNKVHETLEWIYSNIKERSFELDDVIEFYIMSWNQDFTSEIEIVKEEYDAQHYFNKGIKFLADYFVKHKPFKDNTIETEKKIIITLDPEGRYKLIGFIDRLVHNKESNIFEVHDYKTAGSLKSQEELDKDRQLALYSMGIRNLFENVKEVYLVWHYLDFNQQFVSKRTPEQLENLKNEIINLINKIESTKEFPANPGCLCNWCEFKNQCTNSEQAICEYKNKNNNNNYQKKEEQKDLNSNL